MRKALGWIGISIGMLFSCIWIYWGVLENFHEGWYRESLLENWMLFIVQYLSVGFLFVLLVVLFIKWKKIGLLLCLGAMIGSTFFFEGNGRFVIILPILLMAALLWFGEFRNRKVANRAVVLVPLALAIVLTVPLLVKVSQRVDDRDYTARMIEGNETTLVWAPRGPGWPEEGTSWYEANEICRHLSEDGMTILEQEVNIWRLPTVKEAVQSMMLHNRNAGGVWDKAEKKAYYDVKPDKETPLWDVHSKTIYYWLADETENSEKAYIIVYHGGIYEKSKNISQDSISFRAVRELQ